MRKLYSEREVRELLRPILAKLPSLETEQPNTANIHQEKKGFFLLSRVARRENKKEVK
jgi:hypothetical protein